MASRIYSVCIYSVCIYCVCVYLLHLLKTLTNDHNLQGYKQDDHPGSTQV